MKYLTISFLLFTCSLCAGINGTYPIKKFAGNSDSKVIIEDVYGNIISGGTNGIQILNDGTWEKFGSWTQNISFLGCTADGQMYAGSDDFFGTLHQDSVNNISEGVIGFETLNGIICASTGNYVHIDNRILKVGEEILDYNYEDVMFAGLLNTDLVVQRKDLGLFLYAGNNFRKINNSESLAKEPLISILNLENGRFLLIFESESVVYDGDHFTPWTREGVEWIRKIKPTKIISTAEGIFVPSEKDLYQLSSEGELLRVVNLQEEIQNIYADRKGNIWISGPEMVFMIEASSVLRLISSIDEAGTCILVADENLYIGTENGTYASTMVTFLSGGLPQKINDEKTYSFLFDVGQCLISDSKGLKSYDRGRLTELHSDGRSNGSVLLDDRLHIIEASKTGLNLYEKEFGRWTFLNHLYGIEEEVKQVVKDEKSRLWAFGNESGIFQLNYDMVLMTINPIQFQIGGLEAGEINGIFLINGKPIITSSKGVFEFNENLNRFDESSNYNKVFGENSNISYLFQDELENIWYLSDEESGLLKVIDKGVEKTTDKIELPELQRFLNMEHPFASAIDEETIIFGGQDGFLHLDQTKLGKRTPFVVNHFYLENFDKNGALISSQWNLEKGTSRVFEFGKSTKQAKLKFSSSWSMLDKAVNYSYNINDEGWSPPAEDNEITAELKGGKNNVKVRAHYGFNETSNTLVIPLIVQQEWFMEKWNQSIMAGVLSLLLLIFFFILYSRSKIRKRKIKNLESKLAQNTEEIKELKDKNEILSAQLISALNENDIISQLEKLHKDHEDPDIKKNIKKLTKKLKSGNTVIPSSVKPDPDFITQLKLKYPTLTRKDIRLCSLLKMDLTTKDIAPILDITVRGVEISRYRLRKKLNLDNDVVLSDFLKEI